MYFEIFKSGKMIKRGRDVIGDIDWTYQLMDIPSTQITLPIAYREVIGGREEIKLYVNGKCFYGIIVGLEENKSEETLAVTINHIAHEWTYRKIAVNTAVKKGKLNVIYKGSKVATNGSISISANPFDMLLEEELTDDEIIQRAGAQAWTKTGEKTPITSVDTSKIEEGETGSFPVTFYAGTVHVTVNVTVRKEAKEKETPAKVVDPTIIDQLADIYADTNFACPGWELVMSDHAKETTIDYVYSRQNKLEALEKTLELTPDIYYRVRFGTTKVMEIGEMGEKKQYVFSKKPTGGINIRMIEEPQVTHEFEHVINLATVYSEKSDSGMSSMTLREVYEDPDLQDENFPCVILRENVNNERDYSKYIDQYPKLAPNNELEYGILDVESIAIEDGAVIEGTYAFNDLSPFAVDDASGDTVEITDEDRIEAAKTAYNAAVRKLKDARRRYKIQLLMEELPADLAVGDRVRLIYDNSLFIQDGCSEYMKHILTYNDWFYVTEIGYHITTGEVETDTVTLENFLHSNREGGTE